MGNAVFKVTITSWATHNQGIKKGHTHFLVSKRIFDDQKVAELRPNEFQFLMYCYSICADMVSEQFEISVGMVPKYFRMGTQLLQNHLDRLQELQLLTFEKKPLLYNRIEKNRKEKKRIEFPRGSKTPAVEAPEKVLNRKVWEAYENAYLLRYKISPVRNASVNSKISQFATRLGADAISVISFYLTHNDYAYVKAMHSIGLALSHAEALRTQWAKGKAITSSDVRNFEKKQDFANLITDIEENGI